MSVKYQIPTDRERRTSTDLDALLAGINEISSKACEILGSFSTNLTYWKIRVFNDTIDNLKTKEAFMLLQGVYITLQQPKL